MQQLIETLRRTYPQAAIVERGSRRNVVDMGDGVHVEVTRTAITVSKRDVGIVGGAMPAIACTDALLSRIAEAKRR